MQDKSINTLKLPITAEKALLYLKLVFKKQMVQEASTDLINPFVIKLKIVIVKIYYFLYKFSQ